MTRWLIWGGILLAWTIALETPVPAPEGMPGGEFIVSNRYLFAKSMHVAAYAFLTILSAWVPVPLRFRRLMLLVMIIHAAGTEALQAALEDYCHRGGSLEDVMYNQLGIFVGLLIAWNWWMRNEG